MELLLQTKMADIFFSYTASRQLSQLFLAMLFPHIVEFFLAIAIHRRVDVNSISFLIGKGNLLDMTFTLLEYIVEIVLFPQLKEQWWISNIGIALVITGEIIRKIAIITAGRAFIYTIRTHRDENHRLVTHGIYRFIRHPGYCGFLLKAIGIQIMLCNPLCTVAFTWLTWRYFYKLIIIEEYYLRRIFGSRYEEYRLQVPSGVPFVK